MGNNASPARKPWEAIALRVLDDAVRSVRAHDPEVTQRLNGQAAAVAGMRAIRAITELGTTGQLPEPGTPGFSQFIEMAAAGDVEIATVILIRDREYVCEDRVAQRVRQDAPAPAAEPVSLADEMRAMGWM